MKRSEIESRILACKFELQEFDYISRKIVFEIGSALKEIYPDINLPLFDKYQDIEVNANLRREEIRDLEKKLKDHNYEEDKL